MLHDDTSTDNPTSRPTASAEPVCAPAPGPTDDPADWKTVLPAQPCPICQAGRDCRRRDKSLVACRHVEDHLGNPVTGRDGLTYTVFDLSTLRAAVATEIERTLRLFHPTGVIELRLLNKGEKEPTAGYFDCPAKAAKVAAKYDVPDEPARLPQGIYFVLNPLRPATLARAEPNRLFPRLHPLASDGDVTRLRWVFIDIDAGTPAGVSSTAEELAAATRLADAVKVWLRERGFTDPVEAASGNGRHLLYPIDLPNDADHPKLVKQVLEVLQREVAEPLVAGGPKCKVDCRTFNPSRIDKLYGTAARKGRAMPGLPWWRSRLLVVPPSLEPVPVEAVRAVAALTAPTRAPAPATRGSAVPNAPTRASVSPRPRVSVEPATEGPRLRAEDWLRDRGVNARADGNTADGRMKYVLDCCVFNDQHRGKDAVVMQDAAGRLSYHCFHDSCNGRDIAQVAELIGLPDPHHFDGAGADQPRLFVDAWLAAHGVSARKKMLADGRTAHLFECPFDSTHEACVTQDAAGRVGARCQGDGCEGRGWQAFSARIGHPSPAHYDAPRCAAPATDVGDRADHPPAAPKPTPDVGYDPGFISSAALATGDFALEWLVKNVVVRGQPAVVGGPQKSLKTGTAVDLALSLGSGTPFLGAFEVEQPVRVALLSGESGEAVLQETAKRICAAKKIDLSKVEVVWGFRLPQLADACQMAALRDRLRDNDVEVLILDPLYLCLLAGQGAEGLSASNMYQIGPLLLSVARTCLEVGVTPILLHHTKKTLAEPHQPLGLEDLAFAGIGEFARQWLLLSRREPYTPGSGLHRLWLSAGGSAGHSGLWGVDVQEGVVKDDFSGRTWEVSVTDGTGAQRVVKEERQARRDAEDDTRILDILTREDPKGAGVGYTKVRSLASLSNDKMTRAVSRLVKKGLVEEGPVEVPAPRGKTRPAAGLRKRSPGSPGRPSAVPVIPATGEPVSDTPGSSGAGTELLDAPADRAASVTGTAPIRGAVSPGDAARSEASSAVADTTAPRPDEQEPKPLQPADRTLALGLT